MTALKGVERMWDNIGFWLYIPGDTRQEIGAKYSMDDDRLRAVLEYAVRLHPFPSWRIIIQAFHWMEEHQLAARFLEYVEPVTGSHVIA